MVKSNIRDLNIKIFADGADPQKIFELDKKDYIKGFTTNPSLMRKAGVKDYKSFAIEILNKIKDKPISFEIFADDLNEMQNQAEKIASWGENVYVKIPITNTKKISTCNIVQNLSSKGIKLNITAIFTNDQLRKVLKVINKNTPAILSVFAGRIADAGYDAQKVLAESVKLSKEYSNCEILWASTREIYNIIEAEKCGCHIITVPNEILDKLYNFGKGLEQFSLETVKVFFKDAQDSKFNIS